MMANLGTDENGSKWRQVWWIQDHQTGKKSRPFVSLDAACRELDKKRWTDPELFADIEQINNSKENN